MLFIEAERMASCLYDPADCESERTVIISELQGAENDPEQRLDTEITATAFKAHPYRHPTIGWIHDLRTMTRDDLYGHYRRYYVPNNATLVVVGDVDTADAMRRVERAFARHRPGRAGPAAHDRGAGAGRRAPGAPAQAGDDGLLAGRLPRPAIHRSRLLSAAGPRRHPHRGVGAEHLVGRAGADAPARPRVSTRRW